MAEKQGAHSNVSVRAAWHDGVDLAPERSSCRSGPSSASSLKPEGLPLTKSRRLLARLPALSFWNASSALARLLPSLMGPSRLPLHCVGIISLRTAFILESSAFFPICVIFFDVLFFSHIFFCICLLILSSVCSSISTRCSVDEAGAGPGGSYGAAPRLCSSQLPLGAHGGPWGPVVTRSLCPWGGAQGSLTPGGHGGPPWVSMAGLSRGFSQLWPWALGLFLLSSAFGGMLERLL